MGGIQPAMVEAAADNLKNQGRGRPRQSIQAAMVELAAKGEARITHVMGGAGWAQGAVRWAVADGWYSAEVSRTLLTQAEPRITTMCPHTPTLLEMGSGWEGGTDRFSQEIPRVVTWDAHRQNLGERGKAAPEILGKFSRGGKKAVRWAASKAGVSKEAARLLWVSPACVKESVANGLGKSRGCGQGVFGGEEETSRVDSEVDTILDGIEDWKRE